MSTFRHTLMVRFTKEATEEEKRALFDGLAQLPKVIDVIRRFEFGPDLGLGDGNPDMALVADFDSQDDWMAYQEHPAHEVVFRELVAPIAKEHVRVQYLVE